jgi:hypothetical protein
VILSSQPPTSRWALCIELIEALPFPNGNSHPPQDVVQLDTSSPAECVTKRRLRVIEWNSLLIASQVHLLAVVRPHSPIRIVILVYSAVNPPHRHCIDTVDGEDVRDRRFHMLFKFSLHSVSISESRVRSTAVLRSSTARARARRPSGVSAAATARESHACGQSGSARVACLAFSSAHSAAPVRANNVDIAAR